MFFHAMEKTGQLFPHCGKKFSTLWKTSLPRVRRPQACHAMGVDVDAEDFFPVLTGCFAKITREFSDDGALRTTRAGLVSASGRPQHASAEKARVGFRAVKTGKKSSFCRLRHTPHAQPNP
jgi:hypothetical protein